MRQEAEACAMQRDVSRFSEAVETMQGGSWRFQMWTPRYPGEQRRDYQGRPAHEDEQRRILTG